MEEYADLYQLLSKDYEASHYYSLLPYDVKQALEMCIRVRCLHGSLASQTGAESATPVY